MRLNQITVSSTDMPRSVEFYKTLGMELIVDTPHYTRFLIADGQATFSVALKDQVTPQNGTTVYFECDKLDEKVDELVAKGLVFTQMPEDQRYLWRTAELNDPDGNVICLYYGGENRIDPPWRVKAEKIENN